MNIVSMYEDVSLGESFLDCDINFKNNRIKNEFNEFIIKNKIIMKGNFVTKSNRETDIFFNFGLLHNGNLLNSLIEFFIEYIHINNINFDIVFGPAYKGIPLSVGLSVIMNNKYNKNVSYLFNRKEIKDHGEKGCMVGDSDYNKRILIVDDVLTSGLSVCNTIDTIKTQHVNPNIIGILIGINREENSYYNSNLKSKEYIEKKYNVPLYFLTNKSNLERIKL